MSAVELFSYEACPYAQRTRMTLLEKGIEHKITEVDLYNRPDWWADLSPYGKVPLIKHGNAVIYESAIINQYLEEAFPAVPLMPTDPAQRAVARIWIDYCDSYFMAAAHDIIAHRKDGGKRQEAVENLAEKLEFMEKHGLRAISDKGPFWMGEQLTLVDMQYAPFFERFDCYADLWGAYIPPSCTRLLAWWETMKARESWQATHNDFDFHIQRYRKYDEAA